MKLNNIVKKLEKEGYNVYSSRFMYWDVPHVTVDGNEFALADCKTINGSAILIKDFIYTDVQDAISKASSNNDKPHDKRIYSMQDYYYRREQDFYYSWK